MRGKLPNKPLHTEEQQPVALGSGHQSVSPKERENPSMALLPRGGATITLTEQGWQGSRAHSPGTNQSPAPGTHGDCLQGWAGCREGVLLWGQAYTCRFNPSLVYLFFLETRLPAALLTPQRALGILLSPPPLHSRLNATQGETERIYSATYSFQGADRAGLTSSGGKIYLQNNEHVSHKHSGISNVLKRHGGVLADDDLKGPESICFPSSLNETLSVKPQGCSVLNFI